MVDNVSITAGSGTTVAADDIAGVMHQRVKISVGADGSASDMVGGAGAVSAAVPRVTLASDDPAVVDLAAIEVLLTSMDSDTSRLTSSAGPTAPGAALSTTSFMVGARYNATPPTFTDGQEGGLQLTSAGRLITNDTAGNALLTTIDADTSTLAGAVNTGRVAVDLISGQAGVTAGAGAVAANTPRLTLASDDPAVASLSVLDDWDETNRCAVNLISGQAGVAGGSGANGATVQRVTIATDDQTAAHLNNALKGTYETIAASQTDQTMGPTGATGDFFASLLIIPANLNPGAVSIKDGAGSAITVFTGGTASITTLHPFSIPLNMVSAAGAWKVTTGASVSAIGIGKFT